MSSAATSFPPPEEEGFDAAVQAWEAQLRDSAVLAEQEARWLAEEIAEDPSLAVAIGWAPDPRLLPGDAGAVDDLTDADGSAVLDRSPAPDGSAVPDGGAVPDAGAVFDAGAVPGGGAVPDAQLSDFALVARIRELDARVARIQAEQAAAMAELAGRSVFVRRDDAVGPLARTRLDTAEDRAHRAAFEVSAALRIPPQTAGRRLAVAIELRRDLPATMAQLRAGCIGLRVAELVAVETRVLPPVARAAVEAKALAAAPRCTPTQLERKLRTWVLTADPRGAEQRHRDAKSDRRFRVQPLPDGMAELRAVLTADGALTVATAVDAVAAAQARLPDGSKDPRTVDQRRADALVEVCADVLAAGHTGCAAPDCGDQCVDSGARPGVNQRADAAVDAAAEPDPQHPPGEPPGRKGRRRRLARFHGHRPHIQVTVPITTLLGIDDLPGQLAGYGAITAQQARRIAVDGTRRRLLTDPVDGRLLQYGRTRRDPPADLADFVSARDVTDRFPTSLVPAHRCEIDHAHPWERGGTTDPANLNAVSHRAHRVRHESGWTVSRTEGGGVRWRSPTGHTYDRPPEQVGPTPTDRALTRLGARTDVARGNDPDPPPF